MTVSRPGPDDRATTPLVSIGIPVYNGERFLPRALDALLAQEWPNLELLVSDNASTDASAAIAERYAARDARLRVLRAPVNAGVEANFMRVLAASHGEYFMWAACDDWWAPQFVSRLVTALQKGADVVVAMSAVERVNEAGEPIDVVAYSGSSDPGGMRPWQLTMQLASGRPYHLFIYGLYRADFLKRAFTGFAPVVAADRLFMCRVAMAGRFAAVPEILHRRVIRHLPLAHRYADEAIGQLWRAGMPRWRMALRAGPYLWNSPVLPAARRLWVPAVVARFMKASLGHMLVQTGWARARGSRP